MIGGIVMGNGEMWNMLVEYGVATEEELQLVTNINGYNEETLCDVLYARTGYRDFEQWLG